MCRTTGRGTSGTGKAVGGGGHDRGDRHDTDRDRPATILGERRRGRDEQQWDDVEQVAIADDLRAANRRSKDAVWSARPATVTVASVA